jgi:hypothetical protein
MLTVANYENYTLVGETSSTPLLSYLTIIIPAIAAVINAASISSHGQERLIRGRGWRMLPTICTSIRGRYSLPFPRARYSSL